jgi:FdhD protein
MENLSTAPIRMRKISIGRQWEAEDQLAVEEPLEIQLMYNQHGRTVQQAVSVTMRTPGHDEELAIGFLLTEGIIRHRNQVARTAISPVQNKVLVVLNDGEAPVLQPAERHFYANSGCGVCGKASIDAIRIESSYQKMTDGICVAPDLFYYLEEELRKQQLLFESTGSLHAAALFTLNGRFMMLREDVGRHNALDKLIGAGCLSNELPFDQHILLLSGRAGFELVQKAAMAGIKIVAAIGAPSSLAVKRATEEDITLIGFLRDKRFNIYSGDQRIDMVSCIAHPQN